MTRTTSLSLIAAAAVAISGVESFSLQPTTTARSSTTALNLVPEQGKQLEAAVNAAYASAAAKLEQDQQEQEENGYFVVSADNTATATATATEPKQSNKLASARTFVSKVFSLPSSIIRGHPHPNLEGLLLRHQEEEQSWQTSFDWNDAPGDDVVLFPLVGFQFVQDAPNHYGVLPSSKCCNPSCRLRTSAQSDEELVGWFSKACHLQPLLSDQYCEAPSSSSGGATSSSSASASATKEGGDDTMA